MSHDEFAHADAAYVLGALSAAERRGYQEHLAGCADCARSVQELAGLPGLLSRLDEDDLDPAAPGPPPLPDTLLPALCEAVRRSQRHRRRGVLAGIAAAAVVAAGGIAFAGLGGPEADSGSTGREMAQLGQQSFEASLVVEPVRWGTRLTLTCRYAAADGQDGASGTSYALVIHTRDGRSQRLASWRAVPGRSFDLEAATSVDSEEIESVDVRTLTGRRVLELTS
jgi:anti-sigma factor RsiW